MRVVQYIYGMNEGGAETLVKNYALKLKSKGVEPIILVHKLNPSSANEKILRENGISIIPMFKNKFYRNNLFYNHLTVRLLSKHKLKKIINDLQPDVLHIHLQLLKYVQPISNSIKKVRLFYTCHSLPEKKFDGPNHEEYDSALHLIKNNNLQLIAIEENMAQQLNSLFNVQNTAHLYNGIDFKRFYEVSESQAMIREDIGIPKNAFVVGCVGRFSPEKNHNFIIEVFNEIRKKNDGAFLLLIGDGAERYNIQKKINDYGLDDSVLILSNRSDIPRLLKSMNVFISPAIFEGLGIAIIEAQVAGIPCIVSERIPQEAFISNYITRLNLEQSATEWGDAVLSVKKEGNLLSNANNFDIDKVVDQLISLYNN